MPQELAAEPRWIRWRRVDGTKRPDGSTADPSNWVEFSEVALLPRTADSGIGFVFTGGADAHGGGRYVALDLDACYDELTGEVSDWAAEILRHLPTYVERTPSGTGLRVWWRVLQLPPKPIRTKVKVPAQAPIGCTKTPELQVFGATPAAAYVTVSGDRATNCPEDVATLPNLDWLVERFGLADGVAGDGPLPAGTGPVPTHYEIDEALSSRGRQLAAGQWKQLGYPSASDGWCALVGAALRAANDHGEAVVDWLLKATPWGAGTVDSKDPRKYAKPEWVRRDVARLAAKSAQRQADAGNVFDPLPDAVPAAPPAPAPDLLIGSVEFLRRRHGERWLVKGLLPSTGLAQIYGDPGCGKTPVTMSLAITLAAGLPTWFGRPLKRTGPVVYMVGEDASGLGYRLEAEAKALGVDVPSLDQRLLWTTRPGRLCDEADAVLWLKAIRAAAPEAALVVIDTQSRNFGAGDENSTQDMTAFVHHLAAIAERLGCLVLLVHHTGHAAKDRARGSSVLFGALDASYEVRRFETEVRVTARKSKNWATPEELRGELVPVEVGVDEDGEPVTAVTLRQAPPTPKEGELTSLEMTDELREVLELLREPPRAEGYYMAEIQKALDMTRTTAQRILQPALAAGAVAAHAGKLEGGGARKAYLLTARGVSLID